MTKLEQMAREIAGGLCECSSNYCCAECRDLIEMGRAVIEKAQEWCKRSSGDGVIDYGEKPSYALWSFLESLDGLPDAKPTEGGE